jgi:hypothetical protein
MVLPSILENGGSRIAWNVEGAVPQVVPLLSKTRESPLSTLLVVCDPVWLMMDGKCWKEPEALGQWFEDPPES